MLLSSSSLSLFTVVSPFTRGGLSQGNCSHDVTAHGKCQHMQPARYFPHRPKAVFSVVAAFVRKNQSCRKIHRASRSQGNSMLTTVNLVLIAVELDFHYLL